MSLLPDDFDTIPRKAPLFWDVVRLFDPEAPPWDDLDRDFQNALDHAVAEIVPAGDALREAVAEAKRWEDTAAETKDDLDDAVREAAVLRGTVATLEAEIARLRRSL